MGDKSQEYRSLSREELNELAGEELPERAARSEEHTSELQSH